MVMNYWGSLKKAISYRMAPVCRHMFRVLPDLQTVSKNGTVRMMYFCGQRQLDMLNASLTSLALAWRELPLLTIALDGTVPKDQVAEILSWWQGPLRILDWTECIDTLEQIDAHEAIRFARTHVIGRKFASVQAQCLEEPIVYVDTDVLWFRELEDVWTREITFPYVHMSEDVQPCYNWKMETAASLIRSTLVPLCSGFMVARGNLSSLAGMDAVLHEAATSSYHFNDQTVFAAAHVLSGGKVISRKHVFIEWDDRYSLGFTFPGREWTARHYVGPARHLFWRDIIGLRVGKTP